MTKRKWWLSGLAGALVALVLILAVGSRLRAEPAPAVIIAAGDIAGCKSPGREATAALVEQIPGTVLDARGQRLPGGRQERLYKLLRPNLGPLQRPHEARARQP